MKTVLLTVFLLLGCVPSVFGERTITDMAGRRVPVPEASEIRTVFPANPVACVLLFSLDMGRMAGWNIQLSPQAKGMLPPAVRDLPFLGTLYGHGKSTSEEEILKTGPQLILLMGEIHPAIGTKADEICARLHLPVVVLDNDLEKLAQAYALLGTVLGKEDRARTLGEYASRIVSDARAIAREIPDRERKRVYYSLDRDGLKTYPAHTMNAGLIELCGAVNVVDIPYERTFGPVTVSFEQLVNWRPERILAGSYASVPHNDGNLYAGRRWDALSADISVIPHLPFNVLEKPPSVNRIAGIIWLQKELYPERVPYSVEEKLSEFYGLFYRMQP
jgi:iron complex transport system substrate-binding protein